LREVSWSERIRANPHFYAVRGADGLHLDVSPTGNRDRVDLQRIEALHDLTGEERLPHQIHSKPPSLGLNDCDLGTFDLFRVDPADLGFGPVEDDSVDEAFPYPLTPLNREEFLMQPPYMAMFLPKLPRSPSFVLAHTRGLYLKKGQVLHLRIVESRHGLGAMV